MRNATGITYVYYTPRAAILAPFPLCFLDHNPTNNLTIAIPALASQMKHQRSATPLSL
jgi:hypothetical protein